MSNNHNSNKNFISYDEYPYLVYVRVSTDKEEQETSPENQIDICRYWVEQNNFEWNEKAIVFDDGISGTVLLDRAAMQLVLDKARKREIKMVVFKSIHRLARDLRDSLEIKETLIAHGVRLVTIEEGFDSNYEGKNDMKFEMHSMFAAQLPKTISVSISAANGAKVRRGEHVGKVPFGYKLENKKLVIDESEAPTVRKIFKWYVEDGLGQKSVMNKLNVELEKGNVCKPRNKLVWQLTSVQTILKNPTYAGVYVRNRYTKVKINGRKKQIQNPPEKWQVYKDHHPAIVPLTIWEKANSKEVKNKRTKITPWNEFRGLIKCSECDSNVVIVQSYKYKKDGTKTQWRYPKCSTYRRAGKHGCVNHKPVLYENFRAFILEKLKEKGKALSFKFENTLSEKRKKKLESLEEQKIKYEQMNKDLIDLYIGERLITKIEFQQKRKEYDDKIKKLEDEIFLLSQQKEVEIEIKNIKNAFEQLEQNDADLYHAFTALIDEIIFYPDGKVDIAYKFELDG